MLGVKKYGYTGGEIMWILFAFASAFFAGVTSILAKCGIRETDSTVATAVRTVVVLIFSWVMVFIVGSQGQLGDIGGGTAAYRGRHFSDAHMSLQNSPS